MDVYEAQLRELFDDCDDNDDGLLNHEQLITLCTRLQIGENLESVVMDMMHNDLNKQVKKRSRS